MDHCSITGFCDTPGGRPLKLPAGAVNVGGNGADSSPPAAPAVIPGMPLVVDTP